MRILFLGDVVGIAGCSKLMNSLLNEIKSKKIDKVVFDRSGYRFHGRVKAIADTLKENGIKI